MPVALSKFEKYLLFGAFVGVTGALVGGAYLINGTPPDGETLPSSTSTAMVAPTADPLRVAVTTSAESKVASSEQLTLNVAPPPALPEAIHPIVEQSVAMVTAPASTALPTMVAVVEPPKPSLPTPSPAVPAKMLDTETMLADAIEKSTSRPTRTIANGEPLLAPPPAPRPAAIAPKPPTTAPAIVAIAPRPAPPEPMQPFSIALPPDRVTHMYCSEIGTQASWYELKLDPPQLEKLRQATFAIATAQHRDADEFDQLIDLPPKPETSLPWWRPSELIDLDLVSVPRDKGVPLWVAISRRTGRVFLYAGKPINFAGN